MTTGTINKGLIGKEDFHMLDTEGYPNTTFNRTGSSGITTLYHTPNIYMTHLAMVNARYFNSGAMNTTTLQQALSYIGASSTVLYLEPGAWSITSLTVPANVILKISWGAMLTVSGTLTINGAVDAPPCQVFSGGTVTINSTGALWKNTWTGTTNGCLYLQNEGLAAEVNTFTNADATPSVKDGYIFKTANTAGTTITSFDDGTAGQEITVILGDANTTFNFSSGNIRGHSDATWAPAENKIIKAAYDGTYWHCMFLPAVTVSDTAYSVLWDNITDVAPSKNAVYDALAPKANPVFTGDVTLSGNVTNTTLPAFSAWLSATQTNVTGDGTVYSMVYDTEIYDQGADYNAATGVFTAPVKGKYLLTVNTYSTGYTAGWITKATIVTSNRSYAVSMFATEAHVFDAIAMLCDMDAGDTAYVTITASGGTKVVDIVTGATNNYFTGFLAC